jgi:oligopeptide transport system substrate-binding protein
MRILLGFFAIFPLFFFSCSSVSQNEKKVQKLSINLGDEPQTLDPRKVRETKGITLARMLFEGLTRIGKDEKPELALAKAIDISQDLKTYLFHLKDSNWTNGQKVTAEDFVYAWKKMLDPNFPADNAFQLYVIKNGKAAKQGLVSLDQVGVQAVDSQTLKVELEQPTPYFMELLACPCFFPVCKTVDEVAPHWAEKVNSYVSNGPFCLADWKHQDAITVKKNPEYWDKQAVSLDEIELVMVKEETELKMFEKKELTWAGSPLSTLPVDALNELKKGNLLHTKPLLGTYFLRANVERPPFDHPRIRFAFALAIDRKAIVDHVTQGNQIPATGIVPVSMQLQQEPYFKDGDAESAATLFETTLKELGFKRETLPEISLTYAMNERNHLIAQALQQQWFKILGVKVKLEAIERKVYFDRLSKKDYQLSSGSWIADFNDPINFLETFKYKTASTNNTQWEDTHFAQLLEKSKVLQDARERREVLRESEQVLMNAMPAIPIFHYTMLYLKDKKLKDVVVTSMGNIDFKWAYLEDK